MSTPNDEPKVGVAPGTTSRGDVLAAQLKQLDQRITSDFAVHHVPPTSPGAQKQAMIRERLMTIAYLISEVVPPGREQSTALTKLEEAMFWANAGIARTHPVLTEEQ